MSSRVLELGGVTDLAEHFGVDLGCVHLVNVFIVPTLVFFALRLNNQKR